MPCIFLGKFCGHMMKEHYSGHPSPRFFLSISYLVVTALFLVIFDFPHFAHGQPTGFISTIAGSSGFSSDNIPATASKLFAPQGICTDPLGNLYIADKGNHRVRMVFPNGTITTVAGTGRPGFSGDGGLAINAQLNSPSDVYFDSTSGDILISDTLNSRIRKVNSANGIISTIMGESGIFYAVHATDFATPKLYFPDSVISDQNGNIYASDMTQRVRKRLVNGTVVTVAGTGVMGMGPSGHLATQTALRSPSGLALDASGNLLIADLGNHRVCNVSATTGVLTVMAGTGFPPNSTFPFRDNVLATNSPLSFPRSISVGPLGDVFVADVGNVRIRRIFSTNGTITTISGTGLVGFSGDGGQSNFAKIRSPSGIFVDTLQGGGDVFFADSDSDVVRKITGGIVTTVAGNKQFLTELDNVQGTLASIASPTHVAMDPTNGCLVITESFGFRVRRLFPNGSISTIAGSGFPAFGGDGGPADRAHLFEPTSSFVDRSGNVFIADKGNNRIRKVFSNNGTIVTVALVTSPNGIFVDEPTGNLYVAASGYQQQILKITPSGQVVSIAGIQGAAGFTGDNRAATSTTLNFPYGVFVDPRSGEILISDQGNNRVRKIFRNGTIITIIGNGQQSPTLDNEIATLTPINIPQHLFSDALGNLFFAEKGNDRIRVLKSGWTNVTTIAGSGVLSGFSENGVLATSSVLNEPCGVTEDIWGNVYIADTKNNLIRMVKGPTVIVTRAILSNDGQNISVSFQNEVVVLADSVTNCGALFDSPTLNKLRGATCKWLSQIQLQISLTPLSNVFPNDVLYFLPLWTLEIPGVNFTVEAPLNPIVPHVQLNGSNFMAPCEPQITLTAITGGVTNLNRPLTYSWFINGELLLNQNSEFLNVRSGNLISGAENVIVLIVRNWIGGNCSINHTITKAASPLPSLSISGGPTITTTWPQLTILQSSTTIQTCNPSTPRPITSFWQISTLNFSSSSSGLISSFGFSTSTSTFIVPARTLPIVQSPFTAVLTAWPEDDPSLTSSTSVVILVIPSRLIAEIRGGANRTIPESLDVTLDASGSYDPDETIEQATFSWTCGPQEHHSLCHSLAASTATYNFTIPKNSISVDRPATITVTYRKGQRESNATVTITSTRAKIPVISIEPLPGRKVNPDQRLVLQGSLLQSHNLPTTFLWEIIPLLPPDSYLTPLDRLHLVIRPNSLQPDTRYTARLTAVNAEGAVGISEISIFSNSPPVGGQCYATPDFGIFLKDGFTFSCRDWNDEDAPLTYAFAYKFENSSIEFPLSSPTTSPFLTSRSLPIGQGSNHSLTILAKISDNLGSTISINFPIRVLPPPSSPLNQSIFDQQVENLLEQTDRDLIGGLTALSSFASFLNLNGTNSPSSSGSGDADGVISVKAAAREKLMSAAVALMANVSGNGDGVMDHSLLSQQVQVVALVTTTSNPKEITNRTASLALSLLSSAITNSREPFSPSVSTTILQCLSSISESRASDSSLQQSNNATLTLLDSLARNQLSQTLPGELPQTLASKTIALTVFRDDILSLNFRKVSSELVKSDEEVIETWFEMPQGIGEAMGNQTYVDAHQTLLSLNPFGPPPQSLPLNHSTSNSNSTFVVEIASPISSLTFLDSDGEEILIKDLQESFKISMFLQNSGLKDFAAEVKGDGSALNATYSCVFWNTTTQTWSDQGCSLVNQTSTLFSSSTLSNGGSQLMCQCNHLTSFALQVVAVATPPVNRIDLVEDNNKFRDDYATNVASILGGIYCLYIFGMILGRWKDMRDDRAASCSVPLTKRHSKTAFDRPTSANTTLSLSSGVELLVNSQTSTSFSTPHNQLVNPSEGAAILNPSSGDFNPKPMMGQTEVENNDFLHLQKHDDNTKPENQISLALDFENPPPSNIAPKVRTMWAKHQSKKRLMTQHVLLQIFKRESRDPFTRPMRITVLFSFILGSLFVCAMFFSQRASNFVQVVVIGITSALVMLPARVLIQGAFKEILSRVHPIAVDHRRVAPEVTTTNATELTPHAAAADHHHHNDSNTIPSLRSPNIGNAEIESEESTMTLVPPRRGNNNLSPLIPPPPVGGVSTIGVSSGDNHRAHFSDSADPDSDPFNQNQNQDSDFSSSQQNTNTNLDLQSSSLSSFRQQDSFWNHGDSRRNLLSGAAQGGKESPINSASASARGNSAAAVKMKIITPRQRRFMAINALLCQLDPEETGFVDKRDVEMEIRERQPDLAKRDFDMLFSALDCNSDGKISRSEFITVFSNIVCCSHPSLPPLPPISIGENSNSNFHNINKNEEESYSQLPHTPDGQEEDSDLEKQTTPRYSPGESCNLSQNSSRILEQQQNPDPQLQAKILSPYSPGESCNSSSRILLEKQQQQQQNPDPHLQAKILASLSPEFVDGANEAIFDALDCIDQEMEQFESMFLVMNATKKKPGAYGEFSFRPPLPKKEKKKKRQNMNDAPLYRIVPFSKVNDLGPPEEPASLEERKRWKYRIILGLLVTLLCVFSLTFTQLNMWAIIACSLVVCTMAVAGGLVWALRGLAELFGLVIAWVLSDETGRGLEAFIPIILTWTVLIVGLSFLFSRRYKFMFLSFMIYMSILSGFLVLIVAKEKIWKVVVMFCAPILVAILCLYLFTNLGHRVKAVGLFFLLMGIIGFSVVGIVDDQKGVISLDGSVLGCILWGVGILAVLKTDQRRRKLIRQITGRSPTPLPRWSIYVVYGLVGILHGVQIYFIFLWCLKFGEEKEFAFYISSLLSLVQDLLIMDPMKIVGNVFLTLLADTIHTHLLARFSMGIRLMKVPADLRRLLADFM